MALALGVWQIWEWKPAGSGDKYWQCTDGFGRQRKIDDPPPITPADLQALNRVAAEAQGWAWSEHRGYRDGWDTGDDIVFIEDYTPSTDDGQALALCDAVGWALVIEAWPGWHEDGYRGFVLKVLMSPDRPALLTAAAVLALRGGE